MALDRVKKTNNHNMYKDEPTRMLPEERKDGDLTIHRTSDLYGKQLYDEREKADSRGKRLREKFLPNIPGFKAEKLTNRYTQDVYLDKLSELAVDANLIKDKVPFAMVCGAFNAVFESARDVKSGKTSLFSVIPNLCTKMVDNIAAVKKESLELSKLYNKKSLEYLHMTNVIMADERRDWQIYRVSEMDRAYFSQNRLEWFFIGAAITGLHQSVQFSINEMDKATLESYQRIEGSNMREILNPGFSLLDSTLQNFKFKDKQQKTK